MTAAHTPGPWHIVVRASINGARIASSKGVVVGGVSSAADKPLDQKNADAQLIASAPDLLEALKEAQQNWHHMIGLSSPTEHHRLNERMSAAIKKATGDE